MKSLLPSLLILFWSCTQKERPTAYPVKEAIQTIAFGSCAEQWKPQPVLERVVAQQPDIFIYLGDNLYSDTYSMDTLRKNYAVLAAKPEFQKLKTAMPVYAVWDDHDYGWNDSGRHYPFKEESKEIFLAFFGEQGDHTIRAHPGIYHVAYFGERGRRVQIIFPDLRTFRDKLLPYNGNRAGDSRFNYELDYSPYTTGDSVLVGEEQWKWIEAQLKEPADVRIIASSTQFGITHNGYEAWANFPHEQKRMLDVIRKSKANGVVFISGDVHYAEISKLTGEGMYPVYDVTSSGITSTWGFATPNDNRVDGPVMENNFGLIKINWELADPEIIMQVHDVSGQVRIDRTVKLSELKF
jgi:alkaline phosphatase D